MGIDPVVSGLGGEIVSHGCATAVIAWYFGEHLFTAASSNILLGRSTLKQDERRSVMTKHPNEPYRIGMYRISGIIRYLARNQVSGWIRYPVSGTKQYPVLSGILYPVESHIRYYTVHHQLLSITAATDFYGI